MKNIRNIKMMVFIICFVMTPVFVLGQNKIFGTTFGVNIARWTGDADQFAQVIGDGINEMEGLDGFNFSNTSLTSMNIGFVSTYPIGKHLFFQMEYLFSIKGGKYSGSGNVTVDNGPDTYTIPVEEDLSISAGYLELPVMFGISPVDQEKKVKPYFVAGPYFSYCAFSFMKVKVRVEDEKESESQKYKGFNKFDAGLNLGGGLEFAKGVRLDFRYQMGFIPAINDEYDDGFEMYNRMISMNLFIPAGK